MLSFDFVQTLLDALRTVVFCRQERPATALEIDLLAILALFGPLVPLLVALVTAGDLARTSLTGQFLLVFQLGRGHRRRRHVRAIDQVFGLDDTPFAQHLGRKLHERFLRGRLLGFLFFFGRTLFQSRHFGHAQNGRRPRQGSRRPRPRHGRLT